jgi:hypothetical protein
MLPTLWPIGRAIAFRYLCWVVMMALVLYAEGRPAPHLPDVIIDRLPYQPTVDRFNHYLLLLSYVPVSIALLTVSPARFCRYNVTTGLLSLLRGLCIAATGLGPVRGPDVHAGIFTGHTDRYWHALWELSTPGGQILRDAAHIFLTKDLFFSGHTAATFLLLLYVWPYRRLRVVMLVGHVLVVASVFVAHMHYTIDVLGAYAFAYALFTLREGKPDFRSAPVPSTHQSPDQSP